MSTTAVGPSRSAGPFEAPATVSPVPGRPRTLSRVFDTVLGLPVHPLAIHAAVVLVPLAACGVLALAFVPRWRERYAALTLLGLGLAAASAFVAKESGEALAARIGEPVGHAAAGTRVPIVTLALLLVAGAWLLLPMIRRRRARDGSDPGPGSRGAESSGSGRVGHRLLGAASAALAVTAIGMTVLAGHTGTASVWGTGGVGGSSLGEGGATAAVGVPQPSAGAEDGRFTLAQVAEHGTAASCWAAINGDVYDLTDWIGRHPGGPSAIRSICGTDASVAFNNRHGAEDEPNQALDGFEIGVLLR